MAHPYVPHVIHRYESLLAIFSTSSAHCSSWDVLARHHRWRSDDGFIYLYCICKGSNSFIVLFDCVDGHYCCGGNGYRIYSNVDSGTFFGSMELLSSNLPLEVRYTSEGVLTLHFDSLLMMLLRPSILTEILI